MLDCKCKIVSRRLTNGFVRTHCIQVIYIAVEDINHRRINELIIIIITNSSTVYTSSRNGSDNNTPCQSPHQTNHIKDDGSESQIFGICIIARRPSLKCLCRNR